MPSQRIEIPYALADLPLAARSVNDLLNFHKILLLDGDLGAGKTTLVTHILRQWGVTQPLMSPTYAYVHRYRTARLSIYHFDLYRLQGYQDLIPLGLDELLADPQAIRIIEWPERLGSHAPHNAVRATIHHDPSRNHMRRMVLTLPDVV